MNTHPVRESQSTTQMRTTVNHCIISASRFSGCKQLIEMPVNLRKQRFYCQRYEVAPETLEELKIKAWKGQQPEALET